MKFLLHRKILYLLDDILDLPIFKVPDLESDAVLNFWRENKSDICFQWTGCSAPAASSVLCFIGQSDFKEFMGARQDVNNMADVGKLKFEHFFSILRRYMAAL